MEERETIVLEEQSNIIVGGCMGQVEEVLGEISETIQGPDSPKKKRNNKRSEGPVTRANNKKVVLTRKEKSLAAIKDSSNTTTSRQTSKSSTKCITRWQNSPRQKPSQHNQENPRKRFRS